MLSAEIRGDPTVRNAQCSLCTTGANSNNALTMSCGKNIDQVGLNKYRHPRLWPSQIASVPSSLSHFPAPLTPNVFLHSSYSLSVPISLNRYIAYIPLLSPSNSNNKPLRDQNDTFRMPVRRAAYTLRNVSFLHPNSCISDENKKRVKGAASTTAAKNIATAIPSPRHCGRAVSAATGPIS
jgi:hypothetical protein